MRFTVVLDDREYPVEVSDGLRVKVDDRTYRAKVKVNGSILRVTIGRRTYEFALKGRGLTMGDKALSVRFEGYDHRPLTAPEARGEAPRPGGVIRAPMPGRVVAIIVGEGDRVTLGTPLLILEAMKMQNEVPSPVEGIVKEVKVSPGAVVGREDILIVIQ
jgi:biotin carboxyl carrier protein